MRIVIASLDPPWPFGHPASRWLYVLLSELTKRGHDVTMFSVARNADEAEQAWHLFPKSKFDLRCFPPAKSTSILDRAWNLRHPFGSMFGREFESSVRHELDRGFDVLHLESLWSGWLGTNYTRKSLLYVYNLFEIDLAPQRPHGWRGYASRAVMLRAERFLLRRYRHIATFSERLRQRISTLNPSADVSVIPLGIDPALYPFVETPEARPPTVCMIGSFDWLPTFSAGVRLLTELWPQIVARVPDARLQIVGRSARRRLAPYIPVQGVDVHENVPQIAEYFTSSDVLLYAPTAGSGTKVKVLEAFALGTAVVTTAEGVEGLDVQADKHAAVAETDDELVSKTVELLQSRELRERLRRAARQLLERQCGPRPTVDAVERVYTRIVRDTQHD